MHIEYKQTEKYTSRDGAEMTLISVGLESYWDPGKYCKERHNGLIISV